MIKPMATSLLQPQIRRDPPQQLNVRVSAEVFTELRLYSEFINSDVAYVVDGILKQLFRRDAAFQEWLKRRPASSESAGHSGKVE
jgi:hypothetical protein